MQSTANGLALGRRGLSIARDRDVTFLAAGIAYYAFVSLVPLLLLAIVVAATIGGEEFAKGVVSALDGMLTPSAEALVTESLTARAGRFEATLVGAVVLTWSSLRLFRGLDRAFAQLHDTVEQGGILSQVTDGLLALVAIVVGVTALALVVGLATQFFGPLAPVIGPVAAFLTLAVAFFPLYYFFPDVPLRPREVLPGTALAAGGWSLLGVGFQVYATVAATSVYGVLGAALLLVTWLYFGAVVLMFGAALNAAVVERDRGPPTDNRQLQQPGRRQNRTTQMADRDDTPEEPAADEPTGEAPGDATTGPESPGDTGDRPWSEDDSVRTELDRLWEELDELEDRVDDRTVGREEFEGEMRRYVRRRVRRNHARGWGPYLVLLYGTVMTLGAFYYLSGLWAILAMFVIWLSTLGLYVTMVVVGMGVGFVGLLGRIRDLAGRIRS